MGSGKYFSAANQPAIILMFKNLGVWCDGLLCSLCFVLSVLLIERFWIVFSDCCFMWLILRLIDEMVFRVCFNGLFERVFDWMVAGIVFLIVWFVWLFRLVVFCWTVVILWVRRKIIVWRCIARLPLLNPVLKWVCSDSNGWSFDLGVYCLLWKRFLVLNVVLRATQVKSFVK